MFSQKDLTQLRRFIILRVGDPDEAEEIYQETLVSAWQSFPSFSGRSSLNSWLCGIAKHEISDFYHKKRIKTFLFSRLPFLETLVSQALGPEEEAIEQEVKAQVVETLQKLTEGYRVVLRLKYIEGCSVAEIAWRLGLSLKAVESRLTRARFAFREAWEENAKLQIKIRKDHFF